MGCAPSACAVAVSFCSSRPVMATRAPAPASEAAIARPIPALPPVMSTVAFVRFMIRPLSLRAPRPPERAARCPAGVLAFLQYLHAVDQHVPDAGRVGVRLLE